MNGCAPLRMPVIVRNAPIEMYKYAYISPTKELTSSTGGTYGGQYGIYGSSTTKSVNPISYYPNLNPNYLMKL